MMMMIRHLRNSHSCNTRFALNYNHAPQNNTHSLNAVCQLIIKKTYTQEVFFEAHLFLTKFDGGCSSIRNFFNFLANTWKGLTYVSINMWRCTRNCCFLLGWMIHQSFSSSNAMMSVCSSFSQLVSTLSA